MRMIALDLGTMYCCEMSILVVAVGRHVNWPPGHHFRPSAVASFEHVRAPAAFRRGGASIFTLVDAGPSERFHHAGYMMVALCPLVY